MTGVGGFRDLEKEKGYIEEKTSTRGKEKKGGG